MLPENVSIISHRPSTLSAIYYVQPLAFTLPQLCLVSAHNFADHGVWGAGEAMRHEADLMDRALRGLAAAICILSGGCAADQMYGGLTEREYWHYREEFSALMPLALAGNPAAQNRVGALHEYGLAGLQDYDAAATWYRKAANRGDADAQFNLSQLYRLGLGVPASEDEAFRLAKAAADQGHPLAVGSLGMMYADGAGVEKDTAKARKLIKRAADAGVPRYMYEFAILERQRSGYKSAEPLFKQAANAGVSDAAIFVAREHEPQTRGGMIHWFRKSAELGNVSAMSDLGCILIEDGASRKDVLDGIHWLWRSVDLSGGEQFFI